MKKYIQQLLYSLFFGLILFIFCSNTTLAGTYVYDDKDAAPKNITTKAPAPASSEKEPPPPKPDGRKPAGTAYDHKKNQKGPNK